MIKIYTLHRTSMTEYGTYGVLMDENKAPICNTVERPWADNTPFISCIPPGIYTAHRRDRRPENGAPYAVYQLNDVPKRTFIQIHVANWPNEVSGCIATVSAFCSKNNVVGGRESGTAFNTFMSSLNDGEDQLVLIVRNP